MIRPCLLLILLALATAGRASAADGGLKLDAGWARATPAGVMVGVAYLTITNNGKASDRLIGVSSPVAGRAELHVNLRDGDVVQMRAVSAVEVNPGDRIEFKPNGLHVMLVELRQPLKEGDHFPLTLTFEQAGPLQTDAVIAAPGAKGHP